MTARVTYKGQTLDYELFYELCDFVTEVGGFDAIDDEVEVARIAQQLDSGGKPQPPIRYFA